MLLSSRTLFELEFFEEARGGATRALRLRSGDVVIMGGDSRFAYHGVDRIYPGTSALLAQGGRVNLTLRRAAPAP